MRLYAIKDANDIPSSSLAWACPSKKYEEGWGFGPKSERFELPQGAARAFLRSFKSANPSLVLVRLPARKCP
jgi:hypothetical protein